MDRRITGLCAASLFAGVLAVAQNVEPMVTASFDQGAPYNNMCPHSSAAGCGPVAVAQILSYYRQPAHGAGSVTAPGRVYNKGGHAHTQDHEVTL